MNKNYYQEDPEKQKTIVRQSQMERTIELFQLLKITPTDLKQVIALHQLLTNYVLTGTIDDHKIDRFNQWLTKMNKIDVTNEKVFENFREVK